MRPCLRHGLPVGKCPPGGKLLSLRACQLVLLGRPLRPLHKVHQNHGIRFCAEYNTQSILSVKTETKEDATIYALSTSPGRAAIAIIRISGPACMAIYEDLCPGRPQPEPRKATLRTLYAPKSRESLPPGGNPHPYVLDPGALVLYFPSPKTVTGQDVLELHVHGGPAIVKAVLATIPKAKTSRVSSNHVVRYAEPGEFTRRAFYNNRLDLTQIEALGDTLSAETEQQRLLAVGGATNSLAKRYEAWRQQLLHARGELEALIDFSEDQHFEESPAKLVSSVAEQVEQLSSRVQASIHNASRGELLRRGISVALVGAPNAGKSSLLNMIVGREAAIVSKEEGTTRDVVEIGVDIEGYYCRFSDLAGLRGSPTQESVLIGKRSSRAHSMSNIGEVEEEGIRRAKERALAADVVIVVLSLERSGEILDIRINPEVQATIAKCDSDRQRFICVVNKWDLVRTHGHEPKEVQRNIQHSMTTIPNLTERQRRVFCISCEDGRQPPEPIDPSQYARFLQGLEKRPISDPGHIQRFLRGLTKIFKVLTSAVAVDGESERQKPRALEESLGASERQRLLLQRCLDHLNAFVLQVKPPGVHSDSSSENADVDVVLAAESLRAAADCLAKITGNGESGDVEEVLGVIFEKFCVGK